VLTTAGGRNRARKKRVETEASTRTKVESGASSCPLDAQLWGDQPEMDLGRLCSTLSNAHVSVLDLRIVA
jgi:hypothetical protein